jgi:HD-GYP domain-containing protein (c-di-GMP phosphodiesterase class II)
VWDALRSERPYRKAWPEAKVKDYLMEQSGKQFDPKIILTFFQLMDQEAVLEPSFSGKIRV